MLARLPFSAQRPSVVRVIDRAADRLSLRNLLARGFPTLPGAARSAGRSVDASVPGVLAGGAAWLGVQARILSMWNGARGSGPNRENAPVVSKPKSMQCYSIKRPMEGIQMSKELLAQLRASIEL